MIINGMYMPTTCQWIGENNERCSCDVLKSYPFSYCATHLPSMIRINNNREEQITRLMSNTIEEDTIYAIQLHKIEERDTHGQRTTEQES